VRPAASSRALQALPPKVTSADEKGPPRRLRLRHLKADHPPRHVHVYCEGKLVVKWDLDNQKPMKGRATRKVLDLIIQLESEGLL